MEEISVSRNDVCEGFKGKPTFWIGRPHEGPEKYEFDFMCVDFSDGVKRFICKSDIVPKDYWPQMVYIFNFGVGDYEHVGTYEINGGYIFVGLLVIGYWLLVIGYWLLVIDYWLLLIDYWY
jgi:hypothetical protein